MYFYGTEEACAQVGDVLLYFHSYIIVCFNDFTSKRIL